MNAVVHPRRERPLLGLRRTPGRLALAVFRLPLRLYHHDLGWLVSRTFLLLVHTGRNTGRPHEMVAMILTYDPATREAVICSGWGPNVDWVRNLHAGPAQKVVIGRDSYAPAHRFLTEDEALAAMDEFRRRHPARVRLFSGILGWGDTRPEAAARAFVREHPFVSLRPAG